MEGIQHKFINVNGLNMHIAEKGEGPLVLFIHGFPELWYSWRHQIVYLADHGYRAVAPDLRGYGQTTGAPVNDHTKFTIHHVVGDIIGLLDAITNEGEKVFVVGHDWGALIAWNLCLFKPDRVKALFNMSVAFMPWNPDGNLVEVVRLLYGDDYYIVRFQKPGEIEAEFAKLMSYETFMKKFLTLRDPGPLYLPKGKGFPHSPPGVPVTLPPWLSEQDIEYYASQIEKAGGLTGGLNYYRALPL
ncbi:putative soluble epoxide hydrolase [Helianthus anomalus]